jgi:hypothetical protein
VKSVEYYKENPIEYMEWVLGAKLLLYQKLILQKMLLIDRCIPIMYMPRRHGRVHMMKAMENYLEIFKGRV